VQGEGTTATQVTEGMWALALLSHTLPRRQGVQIGPVKSQIPISLMKKSKQVARINSRVQEAWRHEKNPVPWQLAKIWLFWSSSRFFL